LKQTHQLIGNIFIAYNKKWGWCTIASEVELKLDGEESNLRRKSWR